MFRAGGGGWLTLALLIGWMTTPGFGQMMDSSGRVEVTAVPNTRAVAPGGDVVVAVIFDHQDGWHIHTHDPKVPPELGNPSFYIATAIDVTPPQDGRWVPHPSAIQWPEIHQIEVAFTGTAVRYGVFEGRAVAYLPVTVSADAALGEAVLDLAVTYQACNDTTCLAPVTGQPLQVTLHIVSQEELATWSPSGEAGESVDLAQDAALFAAFDPAIWADIRAGTLSTLKPITFDLFGWSFELDPRGPVGMVLLLVVAAFGGMLLNFTPCVLPVIPIKILSLSQAAGNRARCLLLGGAMSAGVVLFWLSIGGAIAFIAGFDAINRLFQQTWFTLGVGVVIAAMAVGMCGLFAIRLPQGVYRVSPRHDTFFGSLGFGVMTAVLSTPCTAPFMGSAAAWATTQAPAVTLITFAAIGFGMALPYMVLAAWPALVDWMPRTGPASEVLKQVMGLLMLAAAAYFFGVGLSTLLQQPPDPPSLLYWWPVAGFILAAAGWLIYRTWQITDRLPRRLVGSVAGVAVAVVTILGAIQLTSRGPITWVYYTPERFEQAIAEGKTVVLDFTAEWCLNCKALEHAVLYQDRVARAISGPGVVPMKVDITSSSNVQGNAKLLAVGRRTIPLLVVFDGQGNEVFKSDAYTAEQVLGAIQTARGEAVASTSEADSER